MSTDPVLRHDPFAGPGETRALCRSIDWSQTSLGPVEEWPEALRSVIRACMDSPFPINLWCGSDLILVYNDGYRAVLGSKHPGALGRPGAEVWREIWPEIEPMFAGIAAGGPPVFAEDAPFVIEREGASEEGSGAPAPNAFFTFSLSGVRDAAGQLLAYLNVVSESTRRMQAERAQEEARAAAERAEARLREVFVHAPAFLAVLRGPEHVFEYVNAAYYRLVGHRELLGRNVWDALPELRGQGFEELLDSVLETGETYVGREVPVLVSRTPDGDPEQRYIDLVYYPITEADGTRSGVVAHGSDVTEYVVARLEAQRSRAEAEQANLAKSQFLAMMSHEIRTPINAVVGYTDLLETGIAGELSTRQQSYVERIRTSSQHLLGLVNNILDLAKIEAGEMIVEVAETGAYEIVTAALEMVARQADTAGISLVEEWECARDIRVLADADRVRQIMLNLLSNALKFTREGGTIRVRCHLVEVAPPEAVLPDGPAWTAIEVADTGTGIPTEQMSRIFEPFVQAESGHTRKAGGTGLGLTISRRFARLMDGDLTVRSELGRGTAFTLWLPSAGGDRGSAREVEWDTIQTLPSVEQSVVGLSAVARTLLLVSERIEQEWGERLRADPSMYVRERLNKAQIVDHVASFLAAVAKTLAALSDGGAEPSQVRDGEEIQEMLAGRHGRQRRRLGWSRQQIRREYQLLHEVVDGVLRDEVPKRTAADLTGALGIVHRMLQAAEEACVRAFENT